MTQLSDWAVGKDMTALQQYDSTCNIGEYLEIGYPRFVPLTVPANGVVILEVMYFVLSGEDEFGGGSYLLTMSRLAYAGAISGRVIDARTGAPLPGDAPPPPWVELRWCGAAPDGVCSAPMKRVDAGADGRFSFTETQYFPQIPAGRYGWSRAGTDMAPRAAPPSSSAKASTRTSATSRSVGGAPSAASPSGTAAGP